MPENDELMRLIRARTSCRAYLDRPVSLESINYCLEAARLAPSACNKQPWRFIMVTDKHLRDRLCSEDLLPGIPMPWLKAAPVIAVLCARKGIITHRLAPLLSGVDYATLDCGIAGEHFVLAAERQGLGTCWIGWFKPKAVKKLLALPRDFHPVALISLGYPAQQRDPSPRLEMKEMAGFNGWDHA